MSNRTNKYTDKAKTPEMFIDGQKSIVPDSANGTFTFIKEGVLIFILYLYICKFLGSYKKSCKNKLSKQSYKKNRFRTNFRKEKKKQRFLKI